MSKDIKNIIPDINTTLFIDVGNSSIKVAYQVGMKWQKPDRYKPDNAADLLNWINSRARKFELIVIISVVDEVTKALVENMETEKYRVLGINDIPDDLLDYETSETLGIDRFFACYGAVAHTNKASVVIDSGTACTIDYMSQDYVYRGGVIMPGISTVESAMKKHAPALPSVPRTLPTGWPGKSTKTSLQWGIAGAYRDSIHASLRRYEEQFGDFDLVLTGGDADWIASVIQWKNKVRPLLVFEGIRRFLEDYL